MEKNINNTDDNKITLKISEVAKNVDSITLSIEDFFNVECEKENKKISIGYLMETLAQRDKFKICMYLYENCIYNKR